MAGLSFTPQMRAQLAAIARLRWQLFVNSLRTVRGRLELVSRTFMGLMFALAGLGGAIGLGTAAYFFLSSAKAGWLASLLWSVFVFWQLFPLMATAFSESLDSSTLHRFPLHYPAYFLVRVIYGSLNASTLLGSLWLLGITVGIGVANLSLLGWAALVLLTFALVNILLARMIFAWVERWLAQRRTREILGILFFVFMLSFQFIGPLMGHYQGKSSLGVMRFARQLEPVQRALPPGLSAEAIAGMSRAKWAESLGSFALLCGYGVVILYVLNLRLIAQYRGESLSEAPGDTASPNQAQPLRTAWQVPGLPGPIAAVFEKELRYLSRSGPMVFTLIMPVFMLAVFRMGPGRSGSSEGLLTRAPDFAFPVGAAYALLMLTNLVYNNFGADSSGVQLFFSSPVRFRSVVLAKNLAHLTVLMMETALVWLAVSVLYRPPVVAMTLATLAGILFALPVNLAAGNLLSIYSPKKIEYGTFGRQRAAQVNILASFGIQLAALGLAALVLVLSRLYGSLWAAALIFAGLAVFSIAGYAIVLGSVERVGMERRETLITELSRM